jgi:hypothetical protein
MKGMKGMKTAMAAMKSSFAAGMGRRNSGLTNKDY